MLLSCYISILVFLSRELVLQNKPFPGPSDEREQYIIPQCYQEVIFLVVGEGNKQQ